MGALHHFASSDAVRRRALELLGDTGPLSLEEAAGLLVAQGVQLGPDPEERLERVLLADDRFHELADERVAAVLALVEGTVLTHRLSAAEVAGGFVATDVDLDLVASLVELDLLATDGGALDVVYPEPDGPEDLPEEGALVGPGGWLGDATAGDLVDLRLSGGLVAVEVVADLAPVEPVATALAGAADPEEEPVELVDLVLEAMAAAPSAFRRPVPPLSEVLEVAGLEVEDGLVAPAGFDWAGWHGDRALAGVARRHGLDETALAAFMAVRGAYGRFVEGAFDEPLSELADVVPHLGAMLAWPGVATAVLDDVLAGEIDDDGSLRTFADRLWSATEAPKRGASAWLGSICAERDGDTEEAERLLAIARGDDQRFPEAVEDAAWYASDRGEARGALALLRSVDDHGYHDLVALLEDAARAPSASTPRNSPCPCGSGRKFKHCHLGREARPLSERATWLYAKGRTYLGRPPQRSIAMSLAYVVAPLVEVDGFEEALLDTLVQDLALFEEGVWDDFLADRGELLPPDELLLAQQWALVERSLHEVEAVRPGKGVRLRDLRTGDRVEVTERAGSRSLVEGTLLLARVVPDGAGHQVFGGGWRIPGRLRDSLLELLDAAPTGRELASFLVAAEAPPRMTTTESEPLVLCAATVHLPDPARTAAALAEVLDRAEDGELLDRVEVDGRMTVRGSVRIEDGSARVTANAEPRFERLLATVLRAAPGAEVVDEERSTAAEALADLDEARSYGLVDDDDDGIDQDDPDLQAALEEYIRDYEERWLDMELPALAGLTPRQAADDPTRRGDLEALLEEFEDHDLVGPPGGGMDAARLRAMLDLE